jgi:hypothetical protein
MEKLDITKQTFYTGIARLKELRLYDYRLQASKGKLDRRIQSGKFYSNTKIGLKN